MDFKDEKFSNNNDNNNLQYFFFSLFWTKFKKKTYFYFTTGRATQRSIHNADFWLKLSRHRHLHDTGGAHGFQR